MRKEVSVEFCVYHSYRSFANSDELLARFELLEPHVRQRVNYLAAAMEGVQRYATKKAYRIAWEEEKLSEEEIELVLKQVEVWCDPPEAH